VGSEYVGCCPFHEEKTPSFTINPAKAFAHCFGCGAHHDVIGFVMAISGCSFVEACEQLGGNSLADARVMPVRHLVPVGEARWVPIMPVPEATPDLMADDVWTVPLHNPKSGKTSQWKPDRVDAYRHADGRLLGYVLRLPLPENEKKGPRKWTPQVTWCVGPAGAKQWCLQHFPDPRPLCGLDGLQLMPSAPVLVLEGEKCKAVAEKLTDKYAAATWPGGSHGVAKVDWSPLCGRDVVLWPDADPAGMRAMLGANNSAGQLAIGVAQYAARAGARSIRVVDPTGQPSGWDIADAVDDGWTWPQISAWAASRVADVIVVRR